MTVWRKFAVSAIGALALAGGSAVSVAADEGGTVISFQSMTPITSPSLLGKMNDRGLTGGGIPWQIASGSGTVDRNGHVSATVSGLVLAPSPRAGTLAGTNPIGTFAAVVSCRTTAQRIVNVQTHGVNATTTGDATINATVDLPHPCTTPEVFVGGLFTDSMNPKVMLFRWFAVSNGDFADAA
jgi:hypothetical protein